MEQDTSNITITKIWFEDERLYGLSADGRTLWQSLLYYPRLRFAQKEQREDYSFNAFGIHWDHLDEDISYESFAYPDPEPVGISKVFLTYPEINVSAFARRIGMKQSLLAAYIHGSKRPSQDQQERILSALRQLGQEIAQVCHPAT